MANTAKMADPAKQSKREDGAPPPAARPARRRLGSGERVQALLDAAEQVIVEEGMHALTMERVATRSGVSRGLVYSHFANRAELLTKMLEREDQAAQEWFAELRREAVDFEDELRVSVHAYFRSMNERAALLHHVRHQRSLEESVESRRRASRNADIAYWIGRAELDGLTPGRALVFATMLMGAAESSWDLIVKRPRSIASMEATFLAGVLASLRELRTLSAGDRRRPARR